LIENILGYQVGIYETPPSDVFAGNCYQDVAAGRFHANVEAWTQTMKNGANLAIQYHSDLIESPVGYSGQNGLYIPEYFYQEIKTLYGDDMPPIDFGAVWGNQKVADLMINDSWAMLNYYLDGTDMRYKYDSSGNKTSFVCPSNMVPDQGCVDGLFLPSWCSFEKRDCFLIIAGSPLGGLNTYQALVIS
jgi:ABC-type proline/glycine betaine transport system substrate-binding protein